MKFYRILHYYSQCRYILKTLFWETALQTWIWPENGTNIENKWQDQRAIFQKEHEYLNNFFLVQEKQVKILKLFCSGWKFFNTAREGRNLGGSPLHSVWLRWVEHCTIRRNLIKGGKSPQIKSYVGFTLSSNTKRNWLTHSGLNQCLVCFNPISDPFFCWMEN